MAAKKTTSAKNSGKKKTNTKTASKTNTSKSSAGKKPAAKANANSAADIARQQERRRFWSFVLLFYGILEMCITAIQGDGLWAKLYEINRGSFGISVFLFAPLIIYTAIMIATDKSRSTVTARIIESVIFMLLISAAAQIFMVGQVDGSTFTAKLKGLYWDGVDIRGGGLAGALIGWPLLAGFKRVGSAIIVVIFTLLFVMLLTNVTIPQIIDFIRKPFVKGYEAVSQERMERAERKPQRAEKMKEKDDDVRVDIAKFYPDDNKKKPAKEGIVFPYDAALDAPAPKVEAETEDKAAEKEELKKIAQKAVSKGNKKAEKQQSTPEPREVYIEKNGQTTMFEKGNSVSTYTYPPVDILKSSPKGVSDEVIQKEIMEKSEKLVETLKTFGVNTRVIGIHRGPSVTRYELQPAAGVKVKQITNLADDIALNLAANGVRIEAPIPGKAAIGIEIPNNHRDSVSMRELIDSDEYRNAKSKLSFAVGKDIEGKIVIGDIASMPHMLIAGTTGSGKSVFTNSIILNILYHASPDEVKLILIDPKKVEFPIYNGIPHLLIPVVTEPLKAAGALGWAVNEMMRRYKLFEANGTKNLEDYNKFVDENPDLDRQKLAQVVIIVDEFADLMLAAKSEVEESVMRLAQLARAAGMHMLIATQSPRVDVLTGLIKANIPSRTALSVSNNTDSRVILDEVGAEKLLGKGDMLYKPVGMPKPVRIQSGFASTSEIRNVVDFLKSEHTTEYSEEVIHEVEQNIPQPKSSGTGGDVSVNPDDDLTNQARTIIVETGNASTAFLQRKLKLGFPRAARIMDEIEEMGIIGPQEGSKPRKINITKEEWYERQGMS